MGLCVTETLQEPRSPTELLPISAEHLHTGFPRQSAETAATSCTVHGKWAYKTFLESFTNYQALDSLQHQDELCNCCRSQPDRTVEIDSSWEYQRIFLSHRSIGNISAYLLGNHRHYIEAWQTVYVLAQTREQKANPGKGCRAASAQATSVELMNSRSEALKGMNIPKLMKFFISLGSEYSFFLFYIIETIKTAPMVKGRLIWKTDFIFIHYLSKSSILVPVLWVFSREPTGFLNGLCAGLWEDGSGIYFLAQLHLTL